ncbi:MAG: thermonuclease family protein [Candidatus Omnitrophica bacterium]|nr:thermonuclease family protein [Candidatus Omnitrophota bacterium]
MRLSRFRLPAAVLLLAACWLNCAQALPSQARVHRVVDGDTIELADGRLVRYIGIDTPEVRRKIAGRWVVEPEPFALAAMQENQRLVDGKTLRLEFDVQTHDRYGRLLAYVYVGDQMVNEALLREGMAQLLTIPPDVKYVERFRAAASEARAAHRGLWQTPE